MGKRKEHSTPVVASILGQFSSCPQMTVDYFAGQVGRCERPANFLLYCRDTKPKLANVAITNIAAADIFVHEFGKFHGELFGLDKKSYLHAFLSPVLLGSLSYFLRISENEY